MRRLATQIHATIVAVLALFAVLLGAAWWHGPGVREEARLAEGVCVATLPIDLSDRAALQPLARLLAAVRQGAEDTPVLLVGAAARDVLLVHLHGVTRGGWRRDTATRSTAPTCGRRTDRPS
jgi:hypothetical protein